MGRKSMNETISRNIKKYRDRDKLSQRELGERLGVNHSTVAYWENGRSSPSVETVAELCEIFDVAPAVFMGIVEEGADLDEQNAAFLALYWAAPEHIRMAIDSILRGGK